MFLDQNNQYSDHQYTTQGNLLVCLLTIDILGFNCGIPTKTRTVFFTELEQIISQFVWKHKRPPMSKSILRNNGNGGISLPDFRLYYKAIVIKIIRYWAKDRHTDKWNKIGSPEMKPHTHGHLVFEKGGINMQWNKGNLLNKQFWENGSTALKE